MYYFKYAIVIFICLMTTLGWSQKFEMLTPKLIKAGDIPSDTVVVNTIKFRNAGDAPLQIKNIKTSCGCTVVDLDKLVYQPGEEGKIKIKFNTKGYSGTTRKSITIFLKEGTPSSVRVVLQASIKPKIVINPRFVNFQNISLKTKEEIQGSFNVLNNTHGELIAEHVASDDPNLTIEPERFVLAPDSSQTIWVKYQPGNTGRHNSIIILDISKPYKTQKRVPVMVNVMP